MPAPFTSSSSSSSLQPEQVFAEAGKPVRAFLAPIFVATLLVGGFVFVAVACSGPDGTDYSQEIGVDEEDQNGNGVVRLDPRDPRIPEDADEDFEPHPPRPQGVDVEPLGEVHLRRGAQMSVWGDFRESADFVEEMAVTVLGELLVRTHAGQLFDVTNQTALYHAATGEIRSFAVEPGTGTVWCRLADRIAILDARTSRLESYLALDAHAEKQMRVDALGRMYLFGPDTGADGEPAWSLTLFDADGAYVKLVTLDEEIRDVAPSITTNRIYFATRTDVFVVAPPQPPEHLVSLGADTPGDGIIHMRADEPVGLYVSTADTVLWMSREATLAPLVTGIGGQIELVEGGIAVFDRARQLVTRIVDVDVALTRDRIRARAARELRDGLIAFAQDNYYRAALHLNRGLRIYPGATRVLYPMAVSRLQVGDLDGAKSAYERFVEEHPDMAIALPDLGAEIAEIESDPTRVRPHVHFNLGYAELREANWRAAVREFENALVLDPDNIPAYYNLAIAQLNLGLPGDAADTLGYYIELRQEQGGPRDATWFHAEELLDLLRDPRAVERLLSEERSVFEAAAARADEAGEDFARARSAYNEYLEEYPEGVYAPFARDRINRLESFERQRTDLDQVEAQLESLREQSLVAGPEQVERRARYWREMALRYSEFVQRHPNTVYLDYLLGRLGEARQSARQELLELAAMLVERKHYQAAELIYRRLHEWYPKAHGLHFNLGQVYRLLGDWERSAAHFSEYLPHADAEEAAAIRDLLPALERRSEAERIIAIEFYAAMEREDLIGMRDALKRSLEADDQYWLAHYQLAITYEMLANPEVRRAHPDLPSLDQLQISALEHITIALTLNPTTSMLRVRARLLTNMRDFERAVADYTILLEHNEALEILMQRAEVYRRMNNDDAAIADLERAIELEPDLREHLEGEIRRIRQDSE